MCVEYLFKLLVTKSAALPRPAIIGTFSVLDRIKKTHRLISIISNIGIRERVEVCYTQVSVRFPDQRRRTCDESGLFLNYRSIRHGLINFGPSQILDNFERTMRLFWVRKTRNNHLKFRK